MTIDDKAAAMAERGLLADEAALKCISPASFWFPNLSSVGSGWAEHAPFAFWLMEALRPKVFVELGTHKGYSFSAFCQAALEVRTQVRCYAVDTWQGDEHAGFYGDKIYDEVFAFIEARYSSFARMVRSTFDDALVHFEDGTVDLLHIDGRHHYEDASHDYTSWIPKLAPNAVVLFHDINVRERNFGVYRLWDELKAKHEHFEFLHGNGLGVLGIGDGLPDRVQCLLKLPDDSESAGLVRQIYSRLGKAISNHYELADHGPDVANSLRGGIEERDAEIIRLRLENLNLQNGNMVLGNTRLASGDSAGLTQPMDNDVIIQRLREDIDSQAGTIRAMQAALKEAEARVGQLMVSKSAT